MKIIFADKELADLYEGKSTKRKGWKSNPGMVKQFVKTVTRLASVERIEDLGNFKGLRYKKLTDDTEGLSAVRINEKFRLHFKEIINAEDPPRVVAIEIRKISNHYKTK